MTTENINEKNADAMFEAILKLKNTDECRMFFKDVCTPKEMTAMAQRYAVAKMLDEEATYVEIVEETGASTATISRVKRSLVDGLGYEIVFRRLNETRGRKKKLNPKAASDE